MGQLKWLLKLGKKHLRGLLAVLGWWAIFASLSPADVPQNAIPALAATLVLVIFYEWRISVTRQKTIKELQQRRGQQQPPPPRGTTPRNP